MISKSILVVPILNFLQISYFTFRPRVDIFVFINVIYKLVMIKSFMDLKRLKILIISEDSY